MRCPVITFARLSAATLFCMSGFIAGVGSSMHLGRRLEQSQQQSERIVCKELQVESLVLVDRAGKQIGWMRATGADGATLMLGHGEGRPMAVMQVDEIEGTPSATFKLSAPEPVPPPGKPTAAAAFISCVAGWPRMHLIAASGREIDLGSSHEHPETALTLGQRAGERAKWPK
jgi:hypothetical protein